MINVVSKNKPKMLTGLDQKVRGQVQGLLHPLAQMTHPRRIAAAFPTLATAVKRVKPVALPQGTARREASPRDGG